MIVLPSIAPGYQLAGADVSVAESAADAARLLIRWMASGHEGLVAIDERLVPELDATLRRRLDEYGRLPLLPIPSGEPVPPELSTHTRIADLIREAVGFHISFREERS
jgi:vacuolar-type H+-ATPase subunit F/Vma7